MLNKKDACTHSVYIKGLCGNCGIRLDPPQSTSVSMIHSVPELKVSEEYAKEIGKADQERLIQERKLVLLVDLDQTILHTTHEIIRNDPNVYSFTLWPGHPTYHTKLRPYLGEFLHEMSKLYELHIFTFGLRRYAHKIASIIDPDQRYFGNRILSREESIDPYSKKDNLTNLFPYGDAMVCIIDDRRDIWKNAANLIQVKPYSYFRTSISDGASSSSSADDEDVAKLEGLIFGTDNEVDSGESDSGGEISKTKLDDTCDEKEQISDENMKKKRKLSDSSEDESTKKVCDENPDSTPGPSSSSNESKQLTVTEMPEVDESDSSSSPIEDPDDHLRNIMMVLERIHSKWYMELDEQRRFLSEGESYKLPDIKDIISRYVRRKD